MENADSEEENLKNKVIICENTSSFHSDGEKKRFCTFINGNGFFLQILDNACKQMAVLLMTVGKIIFTYQCRYH